MNSRPLAVNSDNSVYLIESLDQDYIVEKQLNKYATLIKAPEGIHSYVLDDYSLWSAASRGIKADEVISFLEKSSKNQIPMKVISYINKTIKDFYTVDLEYLKNDIAVLTASNRKTLEIVLARIMESNTGFAENKKIVLRDRTDLSFSIYKRDASLIKEMLLDTYVFVNEIVNDVKEIPFQVSANLYSYQEEAVELFLNNKYGFIKRRGVITMPPGTGKTLVGLKIIERLGVRTLVLVENISSFNTWKEEINEGANLSETVKEEIECNKINSNITIATYSAARGSLFKELSDANWGLIIYDDAHKFPAKETQKTAYFSSSYKLALGSILKRTDNGEYKIYRAIGPMVYNLTIRELEVTGVQIKVNCTEVKLPQIQNNILLEDYINSKSERELKRYEAYRIIEKRHRNCKVVLVSTYVNVLDMFRKIIKNPLQIDYRQKTFREEIIEEFNSKNSCTLLVSELFEKFPLKDIDVLIALSYIGNSEREEYLRIGKIKSSNMKNNDKQGYYYAFITKGTKEEDIFKARIRSMSKYGYKFRIVDYERFERGGSE